MHHSFLPTPWLGFPQTVHNWTQMKGAEQATYIRMTTTVCWIERILARQIPPSDGDSIRIVLGESAAAAAAVVVVVVVVVIVLDLRRWRKKRERFKEKIMILKNCSEYSLQKVSVAILLRLRWEFICFSKQASHNQHRNRDVFP